MARRALKISESTCGTIAIYVDEVNASEILAFLNKDKRHQKKFKYIQEIIFGRLRMPEVYDKEEINQRCKGVTAMKFFKGQEKRAHILQGGNDRRQNVCSNHIGTFGAEEKQKANQKRPPVN